MRFSEHIEGDGGTIFSTLARWDWKGLFRRDLTFRIEVVVPSVG